MGVVTNARVATKEDKTGARQVSRQEVRKARLLSSMLLTYVYIFLECSLCKSLQKSSERMRRRENRMTGERRSCLIE